MCCTTSGLFPKLVILNTLTLSISFTACFLYTFVSMCMHFWLPFPDSPGSHNWRTIHINKVYTMLGQHFLCPTAIFMPVEITTNRKVSKTHHSRKQYFPCNCWLYFLRRNLNTGQVYSKLSRNVMIITYIYNPSLIFILQS